MARRPKETSQLLAEVGQPKTELIISSLVQDAKNADLALPKRFCTYDTMDMCDAVSSASAVTSTRVIDTLAGGKVSAKTKQGKLYAEMVEYNLRNMSYGSWLQALRDMDTSNKYGFALLQHPFEYRSGKGYCLTKLSPRDQKSVHGWLWNENFTEVVGFVQKPNWKNDVDVAAYNKKETYINYLATQESQYTVLKRNQYLHFICNSKGRNPQGITPYYHSYTAWAEKKALEKLEIIGAGKDLGGLFAVYAPNQFLQMGSDPKNVIEHKALKTFMDSVGKLQDGRSSTITIPSDRDASGHLQYDVTVKGIDGGGKQYKTSDIINAKTKAIYNCWSAGFLLLGQGSTGSNALFNGADLLHSSTCKGMVDQMVDVINTQLIPRILAINGIFPSWQDMPEFKPKDIVGISWDEMGKFIQRTASVNKLTEEQYRFLISLVPDMPDEGIEELDYTDKGQSRSGESLGTSGTGNTQSNGSNSSLNVENKSFIQLKDDGKQLTMLDIDTDEIIKVNK